nr:YraN family protein [uncultured Pedobacter sp.]
MARHNDDGNHAEQLAKEFLEAKGYQILEQNWRFSRAEVDIIATINNIIVFIEVKARSGTGFGLPEEFVDEKKQKLLSKAANEYIFLKEHQGEIRFDVIAILFKKGFDSYEIKHIEDAFWNY